MEEEDGGVASGVLSSLYSCAALDLGDEDDDPLPVSLFWILCFVFVFMLCNSRLVCSIL